MMIQQGDVVLKMVDSLPDNVKEVAKDLRGIVLAEGEATGHCHSIEAVGDCEAFTDEEGTLWLTVKEEVTVKHQEHNPVKVKPGNYKIGIVREVDPFEQEVRRVAD